MALIRGVRVFTSNENSGEIESFAVDEHNQKKKSWLKKLYEATVWVNSWLNFKELQESKPTGSAAAITSSDLGCKKDERGSGWTEVPRDDPEIQRVAMFVVEDMDQSSNCSYPYELQEIVHANAKVTGEAVKFNLLLKWKVGDIMEEKYKVEVHKNHEGALELDHLERLSYCVTGEPEKFNMLLKWKLGDMEEEYKVEVHKNHEGALELNHLERLSFCLV